MEEIWKFYKETYNRRWGHLIWTVSNFGRVKCNGKLYICTIGKDGYYYLGKKLLHRIVAELFIPGWKKYYEIDHKDCNKLNNMVTNLLVCNHKQNQNNPLTIQHMRENSRPKKSVIQYTLDNKLVNEFISVREASRQIKICPGNIVKCCKYKVKSAGGYIWRYKKEDLI